MLLGVLRPWHLIVLTFINSTIEALRIPNGMALLPLIPVSYTHLDVYKRQVCYFSVQRLYKYRPCGAGGSGKNGWGDAF